jgi:hypothetical protein
MTEETLFQEALSASHHNIAYLLWQAAKPAEALVAYEKALAIRQKLVAGNPTVPQFQSDLAARHQEIGSLLSQMGEAGRRRRPQVLHACRKDKALSPRAEGAR